MRAACARAVSALPCLTLPGGPRPCSALEAVMRQNLTVTEANQAAVVEALRSIAEIVIWGDQNEPRVFEYFMEKRMVSYFPHILKQPVRVRVKTDSRVLTSCTHWRRAARPRWASGADRGPVPVRAAPADDQHSPREHPQPAGRLCVGSLGRGRLPSSMGFGSLPAHRRHRRRRRRPRRQGSSCPRTTSTRSSSTPLTLTTRRSCPSTSCSSKRSRSNSTTPPSTSSATRCVPFPPFPVAFPGGSPFP